PRSPSVDGADAWIATLTPLPNDGDVPIYLRLSRAIADRIREGKLAPGAKLPGSRTLARGLGVHRNTVLKAYDELASEGWIVTCLAKGTFVSQSIPEARSFAAERDLAAPLPFSLPKAPYPLLTEDPGPSGCVQLFGGSADLRLLPSTAIARAYRRALRHAPRLLGYGNPRGSLALRQELCKLLATTRGVSVEPERL